MSLRSTIAQKIVVKNEFNCIWINDVSQVDHALSNGLTDLYRTCFSGAPYFEKYEDIDIKNVFYTYNDKESSILLLEDDKKKIVGFSIKTPVAACSDIIRQASGNLAAENQCIFGSDLGVDPKYRELGLSFALERLQISNALSCGYTHELTRTSASNYKRIAGNLKSGKRRIPLAEDVEMPRMDGSTKIDQRIYFKRDLSQQTNDADITHLSKVIIANSEADDIAYVFDEMDKDLQKETIDLIKENYPGICNVVYGAHAEQFLNVPKLFDGSMPLIKHRLT